MSEEDITSASLAKFLFDCSAAMLDKRVNAVTSHVTVTIEDGTSMTFEISVGLIAYKLRENN